MGAGQIGGMATLLNIDFSNTAGFEGQTSTLAYGHFIVYYLSHAMVFCVGGILEAHVILTPASCVFGEKYKFDLFGGSHTFSESAGIGRKVNHLCFHKGYNHTKRWESCFTDNMALMIVGRPFTFTKREPGAQFSISRLRYGITFPERDITKRNCHYYGWGSRRNGYMLPLLVNLRSVNVKLLRSEDCGKLWNYGDNYLCMETPMCRTEKFGALCPDDLGSILVCDGFLQGMMTSKLMDRPCGVGFVNMEKYLKFVTCGVDGSRDVITYEEFEFFNSDQYKNPTIPNMVTLRPQFVVAVTLSKAEQAKRNREKKEEEEYGIF